jgi:hypothetical protein
MKLLTRNRNEWRVVGDKCRTRVESFRHLSRVTRHSAFTLAEVLAALLFLALVIPAAVEAIHVASLAGEVAARKGSAARIADRVLNETLVLGNWGNGTQNGTASEGGREFRWALTTASWPQDALMQVVTVEVKFSAQGKDFAVKLDSLVSQAGQTAPAGGALR